MVVGPESLCKIYSTSIRNTATAERRRPIQEAPTPACEHNDHYRNCFLQQCSNAEIYDAVRDTSYWAKEEAHFRVVFGMV